MALYRHASERDLEQLHWALDSADPIVALWDYKTDTARTRLGVEFLALANHRKVIRTEITCFAEHARSVQTKALSNLPGGTGITMACSPACLSMLLTSVSRNLIMESAVGISSGHAEARSYIKRALIHLKSTRKNRRTARGNK